jgi:hypothetical protein
MDWLILALSRLEKFHQDIASIAISIIRCLCLMLLSAFELLVCLRALCCAFWRSCLGIWIISTAMESILGIGFSFILIFHSNQQWFNRRAALFPFQFRVFDRVQQFLVFFPQGWDIPSVFRQHFWSYWWVI